MSNQENKETTPREEGAAPDKPELENAGTAATATATATEGAEEGATTTLTLQQIEELFAKAAKAEEHWDRLVRLTADFDNFKKRSARDRQDAIRYANEALLEKLIPVLDNFDMAMAAAANPQTTSLDSLKTGIAMIHSQLKGVLNEAGLEEIDAQNTAFDPNFHEAISQQESQDVPEGNVLQQMRKGYKLRDRLIRPASVVVAKKPAA